MILSSEVGDLLHLAEARAAAAGGGAVGADWTPEAAEEALEDGPLGRHQLTLFAVACAGPLIFWMRHITQIHRIKFNKLYGKLCSTVGV